MKNNKEILKVDKVDTLIKFIEDKKNYLSKNKIKQYLKRMCVLWDTKESVLFRKQSNGGQ